MSANPDDLAKAVLRDEIWLMQQRINERFGHYSALRLDEMIQRELVRTVARLAAARKRRVR